MQLESNIEQKRGDPSADILVVEDDPAVAAVMEILLRGRLAARVTLTSSVEEAREVFNGRHFDLVTVDYSLPDGDGMELMAEFASRGDHPPMLLVTGRGDEETAARCTRSGAAGYVIKDQAFRSTLLGAVERALEVARAQRDLAASEMRYRRIFETAIDGIVLMDGDTGGITDVNSAVEAMLGRTRGELIGRRFQEADILIDTGFAESIFREPRSVPRRREALAVATASGRQMRADFSFEHYFEGDRHVIQCNIHDVTERWRLDEELRRSEGKFRALFDNMLEGFAYCRMIYDKDGNPVDWVYLDTNKAFERITGLEGVEGMKVADAIPGIRESNPELFEIYGRVARRGEPEVFESRVEALDVDFSVSVFSPRQDHFAAVFEDVTEARKARRAVESARDRLEQIFENTRTCIAVYEPTADGQDFIFRDFNSAAERVERIGRREVVGRSVLDVFPGVEEFGLLSVLRRVLRTGVAERFPVALYEDERVAGWKENYVYRLESGEIVAMYEDVTEEKRAEQSLRESEAKYRFLAENMNDIVWVADLEMRPIYISPSVKNVLGFTAEERLNAALNEQLTPESIAMAREVLGRELTRDGVRDPGRSDVFELYFYHADGTPRCLETSLSFVRDGGGGSGRRIRAVQGCHREEDDGEGAARKRGTVPADGRGRERRAGCHGFGRKGHLLEPCG